MKTNSLDFYLVSSYCYWLVNSFYGNEEIYFDSESKTWQFWLGRIDVRMSNTHRRFCSEFRAFLKQLYDSKSSDLIRNYLDELFLVLCNRITITNHKILMCSSLNDVLILTDEMRVVIKNEIDTILNNNQYKKRNSCSTPLRCIYVLFNLAVEKDLIKSCSSKNQVNESKSSHHVIIRKDDLNNIMRSLDKEIQLDEGMRDYFRFFSIFAYHTGLRASEIFDFKREELCDLKVLAVKSKIVGKKDKIRSFNGELVSKFLMDTKKYVDLQTLIVRVDDYIENVLGIANRDYFFQLRKSEVSEMYVDLHAEYINRVKKIKNKTLRRMLSNVHGFRRGYATDLYERGVDITAIQKLLGHSDVATTIRYVTKYVVQAKAEKDFERFLMD